MTLAIVRAGFLFLLTLAVDAVAADYISSDRPGIADSSEVLDAGQMQIETGLQRETRRAGDPPERNVLLPTLLRFGAAEGWEIRLESDVHGWMKQSDAPSGRAQAVAPASLGFKYRLQDADGPRPSLGAIARVSPPSGTKSLRTQHTTADLRLAADWELGSQWSLNPNVGLALDEDDQGRRFGAGLLAVTLSYRPAPALELFVDAASQRPASKGGRTAVVYDAGLAYLVSRDLQVDVSVGARGKGSTPPRSFLAAGLSFRF